MESQFIVLQKKKTESATGMEMVQGRMISTGGDSVKCIVEPIITDEYIDHLRTCFSNFDI